MTWRLLAAGWRVFVPVILGNAAVQALTTLPSATPAASALFALLVLGSAASLVVATALVTAQAHASTTGVRVRPSPTVWLASAGVILIVGVSGVLFAPLILLVFPVALVVLPGLANGSPLEGFRWFARSPWRAIVLTVLSIIVLLVLWFGALLLGFFIADWLGAALTWLAFGAAGVYLVCAWTSVPRRKSDVTT